MSRVKIISKGNFVETQVFIDGKFVEGVKDAEWRVSAREDGPQLAEAIITFDNVEVEIEGVLQTT